MEKFSTAGYSWSYKNCGWGIFVFIFFLGAGGFDTLDFFWGGGGGGTLVGFYSLIYFLI